jgi:fumarylpyruvate hydrolase
MYLGIVRMQDAEHRLDAILKVGVAVTENFLETGGQKKGIVLHVPVPDPVLRTFNGKGQQLDIDGMREPVKNPLLEFLMHFGRQRGRTRRRGGIFRPHGIGVLRLNAALSVRAARRDVISAHLVRKKMHYSRIFAQMIAALVKFSVKLHGALAEASRHTAPAENRYRSYSERQDDMNYAVPAYSIPTIPVVNADSVFPVRRIYAVGRNYADHAAETGLGGGDSVPGISLKPADSIVPDGADLPYPPATAHLDPEIEMVVAIGKAGADIPTEDALDHVFGYAVGFDLIRRDIMHECIANQHSWDLCKSFDGASPVSALRRAAEIGHPVAGEISLDVNGDRRQSGDLSQMIWKTADIISRISQYSRIKPGDIVFTGTPKGPQPVVRGDRLDGRIAGVGTLNIKIA